MTRSVRVTKRLIDILGATVGLALTAPLYPVIAAAIYIQSPGPVLIRQKRAGMLIPDDLPAGAPPKTPPGPIRVKFVEFTMYKFRSMKLDAEKLTGPVLASENDPRVTPLGRILRKTRLDELPQLLNVLLGDMSIVGPRPERPQLMEVMAAAIPYYEERMRDIKPGITGLAQISLSYSGKLPPNSSMEPHVVSWFNPYKVDGAEESLADDLRLKLVYDLAYSVATDRFREFLPLELKILLKTPLVMIRGAGQ